MDTNMFPIPPIIRLREAAEGISSEMVRVCLSPSKLKYNERFARPSTMVSWFFATSLPGHSSFTMSELRFLLRVIGPLYIIGLCSHTCVVHLPALCCARGVTWATHSLLTEVSTGVLWV